MNPIKRRPPAWVPPLDRTSLTVAVLVALLAVAELFLHPLQADRRTHYERARQDLNLLQDNRDVLKRIARHRIESRQPRDSLLSLTNRLLEQHELHSSAITPNSDGSMTLSFDATEYVRLMAWLQAVEQQRIQIIDIGVVQTDRPGLVTARLRLSR